MASKSKSSGTKASSKAGNKSHMKANGKSHSKVSSKSHGGGASAKVATARAAMERFKMEVASELGVNLKAGYNGDLSAKTAGSIGGEMVRRMIQKQTKSMK